MSRRHRFFLVFVLRSSSLRSWRANSSSVAACRLRRQRLLRPGAPSSATCSAFCFLSRATSESCVACAFSGLDRSIAASPLAEFQLGLHGEPGGPLAWRRHRRWRPPQPEHEISEKTGWGAHGARGGDGSTELRRLRRPRVLDRAGGKRCEGGRRTGRRRGPGMPVGSSDAHGTARSTAGLAGSISAGLQKRRSDGTGLMGEDGQLSVGPERVGQVWWAKLVLVTGGAV